MKKWLIIGGSIFALFVVVAVWGVYPIAVVDGHTISFASWKAAERASVKFAEAQLKARAVSRGLDETTRFSISRDSLLFLIEDVVVSEVGPRVVPDLEKKAGARVLDAIQGKSEIVQGAEAMYGLNRQEFISMVLMPQARKDILRETFTARGESFDDWISLAKKSAGVRLIFVPFSWDGEKLH